MAKYAIIGGTGRSGTTSLFRYLAAHPQVCGASVKETRYFINAAIRGGPADVDEFENYFSWSKEPASVHLEATPAYLHWANKVAPLMAKAIPDLQLIFLLRNPLTRFMSIFSNHVEHEPNTFGDLTFDEFANVSIDNFSPALLTTTGGKNLTLGERGARFLRTGCYSEFLPEFISRFGEERVRVMFFGDFVKEPRDFLVSLSDYLGLEDEFFDNHESEAENKTRSYRSRSIHNLAFRFNRALETRLNRHSGLRRRLRAVYHRINARPREKVPMTEVTRIRLTEFFRPYSARLPEVVEGCTFGRACPTWTWAN